MAAVLAVVVAHGATVEHVVRPPRFTRGNTSILPVQPIDQAAWLSHPDIKDEVAYPPLPRIVRFRCEFTSDGSPLEFDVTGDERYYLTLDGAFVSRGPHRGTVENWMYQSYRAKLEPGKHVMEATVWRMPFRASPLAQLSYKLGFCLKAEGTYDAVLTTGKGAWKCGPVTGVKNIGKSGGAWGAGDGFEILGSGIYDCTPGKWLKPAVVRKALGGGSRYGIRQQGWMLFPSQLPEQTEYRVRPGKFVDGGEMKFPLIVKPGEKRRILWDLDRYICAYPEAIVKGGKGGKMTWQWAEALRGPSKNPKIKGNFKGNRGEWEGKTFSGFGDRFVFDGRERAVFQPPWFRCGRWCEIVVEAGAEPVEIQDLALIESRYPLECETRFESPEDPALAGVQAICARAMQMCCHEMLFDCPFYEQQMYPGDTRVQLNVLSAMSRDERMIKRAIELYDLGTRDDGMCPFNWPTRGLQEGASYTLCYLCMFGDYAMNHADRAWLRARLPGLRKSMAGIECYENKDGLLVNLPGWNFMDWVEGWRLGNVPGTLDGEGLVSELNLFWVLAMKSAATTERALGNELQAKYWEEKSARLKRQIVKKFWDGNRGLLADDPEHTSFSEHAQCLALLGDVLSADKAETAFRHLVEDGDLARCTVYFSYYLFETYFKFGRGDLFLKRLGLWRDYIAKGLTTTQEAPDSGKNGQKESRSDCHAWGAHPIWFMQTGLAGIRSDAPFFRKVRIAPCPGGLKSLKASHPHPDGWIKVDLAFDGDDVKGYVDTPVSGVFVYGGREVELKAGHTEL